jgi:hypothetical protein
MKRRVDVVFTQQKIDDERELERLKHYYFLVDVTTDRNAGLYEGELIKVPKYDTPMQICGFYRINGEYYNGVKLQTLNYGEITKVKSTTKKGKKMKSNKVMSTFMDNFKRQFLPELDSNLRISMNGQVCAPKGGQYVAIDTTNELVSYPAEFTMEMPVYLISKNADTIQSGDVVRDGNSYSKVIEVKRDENGTVQEFKTLSFTGSGHTVKPIKDFVLGQKTLMVVVNLFNGFTGGQINPMFMLLADKDADEGNDMLMMFIAMQAMNPTNNGIMNNINPMMLMVLMNGDGSNDMFKTMFMMNMMQNMNGGNGMNMFGNMSEMFNAQPKQQLND